MSDKKVASDVSVLISKSLAGPSDMGTEAATKAPEGPEFEAKRYEGRLQQGGILLSVHCDTAGEIARAREVVVATGAEHVSSSKESTVDTAGRPVAMASSRVLSTGNQNRAMQS
jgi:hypothetical protein